METKKKARYLNVMINGVILAVGVYIARDLASRGMVILAFIVAACAVISGVAIIRPSIFQEIKKKIQKSE